MSIYRDKEKDCWRFEFERVIDGKRIRTRKRLPKTWNRSQADAYDRQQTERLYNELTGVEEKPEAGIEDAVALYLNERVPQLKDGRGIAQELKLVLWAYKGKPLSALPAVADAINKKWKATMAPATIRNRIRYLTSACRWAYKHHAVCAHDPCDRVKVPPVNNERQVYTDRAGMLLLAQQTSYLCHDLRALIRIAFYTGMRFDEIMRAEVDTGDWAFKLADTKNGNPRWIPIHPRIRSAIKRLPFRYTRSTLEKRWRKVRASVLMEHFNFHDLRHSAASEMINNEVDLSTVGAVLGHVSAQSTKRYAHRSTTNLAAALGKIGRKTPPPGEKKAA
jgi:integrase